MLDDDIQYMGTRPATRAPSDSPFLAHQTVTGIIMHIERSSTNAPYDLIFRRANTNVIQIGRRPGTEAEQKQGDNTGAMFRCAVVSRKHAKIAFSDSGHAYVIDMNSHHGTHVRKPGETVSRKLIAETPTSLSDGDIITFGKSVGRNSEIVRPVVARIELLRGSQLNTNFKPLAIPATPITPSNHINISPSSSSSRSSSGRYGVFINSSSSDENSPSVSAHDSDIEEIPASGANALPLLPRGSLRGSSGSHLGRAFEALKRLLPPPLVLAGSTDQGEDIFPTLPPIAPLHTPDFSVGSPSYLPSPIYSPSSPSRDSYSPRSLSPMFNIRSSLFDDDSYRYPMGFDAGHNDVFEENLPSISRRGSRGSSSPMDLASPSPPLSANYSPIPEQTSGEPNIIGAWPNPSAQSAPVEVQVHELAPSKTPANEEQVSTPLKTSEHLLQAVNEVEEPQPHQINERPPPPTEPSDSANKVDVAVSELQHGLAKLQTEVTKLQVHKRKYKSRFNANVHTISDKLLDLDERVADVNAQYTMLLDQVEHTSHVDIPDLQAHVEILHHQADTFTALHETSTEVPFYERSDVKESIQALKDLVDEMRKLRESTQANMIAELEAVRAARDAALATIAAHAEIQTPVPSSLKRKRHDEDEDGDEPIRGIGIEVDARGATNVPIADPASVATTISGNSRIEVPSRKRARRVAAVVLQTATAVTVGAVATWSALAFS